MSYARWGVDGSDVYVYVTGVDPDDDDVQWVCQECELLSGMETEGDFEAPTKSAMLAHLHHHAQRGHGTGNAINRLTDELKAEGEVKK